MQEKIRTLKNFLIAALAAPLPAAVIVSFDSGPFGPAMVFLVFIVNGFLVALLGIFVFGLPVHLYALKHKITSYLYYCVSGLVSGTVMACIAMIPALYAAIHSSHLSADDVRFLFLLPLLGSLCAWVCASTFWFLHVRK